MVSDSFKLNFRIRTWTLVLSYIQSAFYILPTYLFFIPGLKKKKKKIKADFVPVSYLGWSFDIRTDCLHLEASFGSINSNSIWKCSLLSNWYRVLSSFPFSEEKLYSILIFKWNHHLIDLLTKHWFLYFLICFLLYPFFSFKIFLRLIFFIFCVINTKIQTIVNSSYIK